MWMQMWTELKHEKQKVAAELKKDFCKENKELYAWQW